MKKITLRTKVEVTLVTLLLITIATASVVSVTRTISDTSDNIDTFVRNSNGKYWECTEANIQVAIDDLSGSGWKGGTVWIPGDQEININTGIVLEDYCILDLGGSYLDAQSDVHMITMAPGSVVRNGQMDTRDVDPFTKSCILFDCAENYWVSNTRVENIYMYGENSEGTGIYYRADNQGEKAAFTKCVGLSIWEFEYGIRLDCQGGADSGAATYINSNIFNNIVLIRNKYQIWLDRNTDVGHNYCDVDGNIFDNCILQTGSGTERGIYVEGRYNRFTNIFTWDWSGASGDTSYELTSDSQKTYLEYFGGSDDLSNSGTTNTIFDTGNGALNLITYNQASEPSIPNNSMAFWCDTDAGPKYYLIKSFGGTQKKVEMT